MKSNHPDAEIRGSVQFTFDQGRVQRPERLRHQNSIMERANQVHHDSLSKENEVLKISYHY